MKVKKLFLFLFASIAIGLVCITILLNPFKEDLWDKNTKLLKQQLLSMNEPDETIKLSDITPFEWDEVYSFEPYIPKEKVYNVIGYRWDYINETVSENMNQIVFLKNRKVVCYLYGYPSNNGYGISFDKVDYNDGIAILNLKDNLNFKLRIDDGVVYLKHFIDVSNEQQPSQGTVAPMNKPLNTRVVQEKEFKIGGKSILGLKYLDLVKLWGKPNNIKRLTVYFPATEEPDYSYILQYDSIDIEMYPVEKNISVEDTESFRFDITNSKYEFYGVRVGTSLLEYLKGVENKDVFSVKEITNDTTGEKIPQEYRKLLISVKEHNYYFEYDKAVYEQIILKDIPYGVVILFRNDKISRIVYGFPNAS